MAVEVEIARRRFGAEERYQHATRVAGSGTLSPLAFPDVPLRLPDIFA
jgi:hypothetical protein